MNDVVFCNQCGLAVTLAARSCNRCGASMPVANSRVATFPLAYASFGERFAALFLDVLLMMLIIFPSVFILGGVIGLAGAIVEMPTDGRRLVAKITGIAFSVLVRWFYFAGCESSVWQGTVGKKILGIRVTDMFGNRISFGRATVRFFGRILSTVCLGLGFWSVLWDQYSQGWHDKIAGTLVLDK